jgi:hypothetical protein
MTMPIGTFEGVKREQQPVVGMFAVKDITCYSS